MAFLCFDSKSTHKISWKNCIEPSHYFENKYSDPWFLYRWSVCVKLCLCFLYISLSPAKRRDIVLNLSVCPSVCPSVRHALFLFCAPIDSETTQPTTMKHIPYESWGPGLCHRGSVFSCPPKFRRDRPLKTAENRVFDPQLRYLYHMKAQRP